MLVARHDNYDVEELYERIEHSGIKCKQTKAAAATYYLLNSLADVVRLWPSGLILSQT